MEEKGELVLTPTNMTQTAYNRVDWGTLIGKNELTSNAPLASR